MKKKIGETKTENLRTIGLGEKRKQNENKMRKKWNGWKLRKDDVTHANRGQRGKRDDRKRRRKNEYKIREEKKEAWHNWRVLMGQNTEPLYETSCTRI